MTLPLIQKFRDELAPSAPMLYVDTGPEGEYIDARLAVGSVVGLQVLKEVVEAAGTSPVIAKDLEHRIEITTGVIEPGEGYEEVQPTILTGQEARIAKEIVDTVVEGELKVSRKQRRQLKKLSKRMLRQNQIPDLSNIDEEYKELIADAKVSSWSNHAGEE